MTEEIRSEPRSHIRSLIKQHWRSPLDAQRLVKAAALRNVEPDTSTQLADDESDPLPNSRSPRDLDEDDDLDLDEEKTQRVWSKIAEDPELASKVLRAVEGIVPDILKRSVFTSVGNVLMSEEGLRAMLLEKNLPKEVVNVLLSQADVMRREILRIISREIRIFLQNMDFGGEISKILTSLSFEIKTEIRFIPNDQAVRPQIKNRVNVKRQSDDDHSDEDDAPEAPPQAEQSAKGTNAQASSKKRSRWALRRKDEEGAEPASDLSEDSDPAE